MICIFCKSDRAFRRTGAYFDNEYLCPDCNKTFDLTEMWEYYNKLEEERLYFNTHRD